MTIKAAPVLLAVILLLTTGTIAIADDPGGPSARQTLRFDTNWKFYRGEAPGSEPGIAVNRWRWKADERGVKAADELAAVNLDTTGTDWKDTGFQDVFNGRNGFAWYRATLNQIAGPHRVLHFDNVDDNAVVFLNGKRVGSHQGWGEPFDVSLDNAWNDQAANQLAVLVENTAGPGGIMGPVVLSSDVVGGSPAAAQSQFDDHDWRTVNVPHDFVDEGTFDPKADAGHGFLNPGIGWYRKSFMLPVRDRGRRIWLDFDGIYRHNTVWINGHRLGTHASGYTGFRYDITDFAAFGGANTVAVRVDSRQFEGWWYEGGGIYRHVWLVKADPLHVAQWGTYVTARIQGADNAGNAPADVTARTTLENNGTTIEKCEIVSAIVDAAGKTVATVSSPAQVPGGKSIEIVQQAKVGTAHRWSLETPYLYHLVTTIHREAGVADRYDTSFGIRTLRFDPDRGFFLNGLPVKIKGTCNHQDFAGVGVALPDRLHEYKIEKLKEMGSNAYRCSHNPPANELLNACDRLGMLVMDENRHLGDTYRDHSPAGTPDNDLTDLADMIRRDRNHPSIIIWSMCNEEGLQGSDEGERIFAAMKKVVLALDATRPISCAMNGGWGQGISHIEDLQGCNYNPGGYDGFHRDHPQMPMYGSETASTVSTRGEYANDPQRGYVSAYDVNAPPWAQTAEAAWKALAERPFMAGGFVWTGFDYRGEPTPYAWPCINSHFGIMDTCGFPKDNYYYYQSWWGDKPVLHLLPHWNWRGKEGKEIAVWCHSNCERVELFLNGKSLGAKTMQPNSHLEWKVKYAPGRLEAKGYRGNRLVAADFIETTGAPQRLQLMPDRIDFTANGQDVAIVPVVVRDASGHIVPTANNLLTFRVAGDAQIIGVGNGDPSSHDPDHAPQRHAFNGYCLVLLQMGTHSSNIRLTAESPGLQPSDVILKSITYDSR
jgi:beta-galactosidase